MFWTLDGWAVPLLDTDPGAYPRHPPGIWYVAEAEDAQESFGWYVEVTTRVQLQLHPVQLAYLQWRRGTLQMQ